MNWVEELKESPEWGEYSVSQVVGDADLALL